MKKKLTILAVALSLTISLNSFAGDDVEQPEAGQDGKYTLELRYPVAGNNDEQEPSSEETDQPVNPGFMISCDEHKDAQEGNEEEDRDNSRG